MTWSRRAHARAGMVISVVAAAGAIGVAAGLTVGAQSASVLAAGATQAGPAASPAVAPPPRPTKAAIDRAAGIMADVRKALGGETLAAVKTVLVTGRTERVRGNNLVPIEFEIAMELPDKYVRRDEVPAEESDPTSTGFNGDDLIQIPAPVIQAPPARAGAPPQTPDQLDAQRKTRLAAGLASAKQDFARLALGMFGDTFSYPLTYAFAAQALAPQGNADVIDAKGPGTFALRFFVMSDSHLPIMVSWQAPPTNVIVLAPGQPQPPTIAPGAVVVTGPAAPAAAASQEEKDTYAKAVAALRARTMAVPVENRLYFADYRDADGVRFPYRLRRAIGADTSEETTFDRFRVNAKIDPKKFQITK